MSGLQSFKMNHLVNDSKSSVASIKTSSASIIGVNGDGNVTVHKSVADTMSDSNTISRSTSDKYNTNHHKTDPSKTRLPISFFLSSFWWIPDFRHKQQLSGTCKFSVWSYSRCTSKKFDSAIRSCQNQFPNQVNLTSFVAQKCSLEWFSDQFQEGYSVFFQSGGYISEKHIHQRRFFSIMAWKFRNNGTYCAIRCYSIHRPRTVEEGTTILDFKVRNECIKRTVKILAFIRFYKWIKVKAQVVEDFWQDR